MLKKIGETPSGDSIFSNGAPDIGSGGCFGCLGGILVLLFIIMIPLFLITTGGDIERSYTPGSEKDLAMQEHLLEERREIAEEIENPFLRFLYDIWINITIIAPNLLILFMRILGMGLLFLLFGLLCFGTIAKLFS